jgi:UPF0716 protein FxsA
VPFILLIFILVPLVEIYLLIQVGAVVGAGWTIFAVVATAVLGAYLVRRQGFATVTRIRSQLDEGELPAVELLEGLFLLVAGALLLTPGFFTDAVGFACLTPPLRRRIIDHLLRRGIVRQVGGRGDRPGGPRTIDGEYHRVDD